MISVHVVTRRIVSDIRELNYIRRWRETRAEYKIRLDTIFTIFLSVNFSLYGYYRDGMKNSFFQGGRINEWMMVRVGRSKKKKRKKAKKKKSSVDDLQGLTPVRDATLYRFSVLFAVAVRSRNGGAYFITRTSSRTSTRRRKIRMAQSLA